MNTHPPNATLWRRLQAWHPDDPGAAAPFSRKLSHEQRWSSEFAQRAIEEYRRFVYLACTLPQGASPSPAVDKVWHLHLTYTKEYWQHFCPEVLQQELHHQPSRGGAGERQRHDEWYAATWAAYAAVFGEAPPADLWPSPGQKGAAEPPRRRQLRGRHRRRKQRLRWWLRRLRRLAPPH